MNKKEQLFVKTVLDFYAKEGRHSLPWRMTKNPYKILVSEVMLQQTQVDRVVPKYSAFLKRFPTVQSLATASLAEVLILWQGLGYNRRAKMLFECAKKIVHVHKGKFPETEADLTKLPGVGLYTASALRAFAFNTPVPMIETNIRAVYLQHFFKNKTKVLDSELLPYIITTLDLKNPREWYYALMDYGSHLKKIVGNQNRRSAHYTKQSAFKGSDRQIRGLIVSLLSQKSHTKRELKKLLTLFDDMRIEEQLKKLEKEAMITRRGTHYTLPR